MTPRDRRVMRWGIATIVAALLVLRVVPWGWNRLVTLHALLRERSSLLARAQDELRQAGTLADSAAALSRALVTLAPALLAGGGRQDAFADLSGRLSVAASQSRAKVERVELLPDSAAAGRLRRVRGRAAFEGDIRGLVRFLASVESGGSLVAVQDLVVQAPAVFGPERGAEALRWEVTVSGWYLGTR